MLEKSFSSTIEFHESEIEGSIIDRFNKVSSLVPDKIAVITPQARLSYLELAHGSNQIAEIILDHTKPQKGLIGLLLEQTPLAIAAFLGVLKAGYGFVIFPPEAPLEQIQLLWRDALQPYLLTDSKYSSKVQQLTSDFINLEKCTISYEVSNPIQKPVNPGDLAAILYTSGSTGQPKGVIWSHRLILHTAHQNQESYQINPHDRSAMLASFGFGMALTQKFAALLTGASLHLFDVKKTSFSALIDWLQSEKITVLAMPPIGLFRQLLDFLSNRVPLEDLRLVLLGGESFYKGDVVKFRTCFKPSTVLVYRFGGSETMLIREMKITPSTIIEADKVSVGYQIPDKEILILDDSRNPVMENSIGELAVRSKYLATGYWNNPTFTNQVFLPDPQSKDYQIYLTGDLARINQQGQMVHLGRKDFMVKIRGFSIQLEAIEAGLLKIDEIQQAVVTTFQPPSGDLRLAAYLVSALDHKLSTSTLRSRLSEYLPSHMIPSVYTWMDDLPITSNGKLDRSALPLPSGLRPEMDIPYVPATNEIESQICQIWQELLYISKVGIHDNFFELGGDSLLSLQMTSRVEKLLNCSIPPEFFSTPTISHLLKSIDQFQNSNLLATDGDLSFDQIRIEKHGQDSGHHINQTKRMKHSKWRILARDLETFSQIFPYLPVLGLPFKQGNKLLNGIFKNKILTRALFLKKYSMFKKICLESNSDESIFMNNFFPFIKGNILFKLQAHTVSNNDMIKYKERLQSSKYPFWKSLAQIIQSAPLNELDKYFSVSGLEFLVNAYQKQEGVIILTYHSTINRLAIAALPRRLNVDHITTISQKIARQRSSTWELDRGLNLSYVSASSLYASVALNGQHLLEKGRIVQFVSDIETDPSGFVVQLASRQYNLKTGFAELALNTGAAIVPQYSTILPDGRIHTAFSPALQIPNGSRADKIYSLFNQYIDFMNDCWKLAPESLKWNRIRTHLTKPLFSENDLE